MQPVDCVVSEWENMGSSEYDGCSVPCGGGKRTKMRRIVVQAKNGGKPCGGLSGEPATLEKTESCNVQLCLDVAPIDCSWTEWTQWSECDVCGDTGQRTRTRQIKQTPQRGGKVCEESGCETGWTQCDRARKSSSYFRRDTDIEELIDILRAKYG